jgi:hypothetical protein
LCPQPDGQAAIFPMADFLIVTMKKTMAANRKNPARGLGGERLIFLPKACKAFNKVKKYSIKI